MKAVLDIIIEHFINFEGGYGNVSYRIIVSGATSDGTICHASRLWKQFDINGNSVHMVHETESILSCVSST
jgi:hypothetical protein